MARVAREQRAAATPAETDSASRKLPAMVRRHRSESRSFPFNGLWMPFRARLGSLLEDRCAVQHQNGHSTAKRFHIAETFFNLMIIR
jgi:hypothetical protein